MTRTSLQSRTGVNWPRKTVSGAMSFSRVRGELLAKSLMMRLIVYPGS